MTEVYQVEPATDDEVVYDPESKRATHVESGLAVEYIRDDDPRERRSYFKLIVDDKEYPFEAFTDAGGEKIKEQYPDMDFMEQAALVDKLWEKNYRANNLRTAIGFNREIFVKIWQRSVFRENSRYKRSVFYREWDGQLLTERNHQEWRCEG